MPGQQHIPDGGDVAQGAKADAAITTDAAGTISGKLRGLVKLLVDQITVKVAQISGVAPQMDDTDKLAVSLYGKTTVAGDTAILASGTKGLLATFTNSLLTPVGDAQTQFYGLHSSNTDPSMVDALSRLFNGTSWDRERNNGQATLLASAVRAADTASADQVNYNARGVAIFFNITAVPGTDTVDCIIQGKDPVSGNYVNFASTGAKSATGTYVLVLYPAASNAAGAPPGVNGLPLPRTWRVNLDHSAATNFTYSVGACYIN